MENRSYPRWAALFIAPVACAIAGYNIGAGQAAPGKPPGNPVAWAVGGAVVGVLIGLVILLLDPAPRKPRDDSLAERVRAIELPPGTLVGRFLSIAGLLMFFIPFVGLVLSAFAVLVNWGVKGWPRTVAFVAAGLGAAATAALFLILALAK